MSPGAAVSSFIIMYLQQAVLFDVKGVAPVVPRPYGIWCASGSMASTCMSFAFASGAKHTGCCAPTYMSPAAAAIDLNPHANQTRTSSTTNSLKMGASRVHGSE